MSLRSVILFSLFVYSCFWWHESFAEQLWVQQDCTNTDLNACKCDPLTNKDNSTCIAAKQSVTDTVLTCDNADKGILKEGNIDGFLWAKFYVNALGSMCQAGDQARNWGNAIFDTMNYRDFAIQFRVFEMNATVCQSEKIRYMLGIEYNTRGKKPSDLAHPSKQYYLAKLMKYTLTPSDGKASRNLKEAQEIRDFLHKKRCTPAKNNEDTNKDCDQTIQESLQELFTGEKESSKITESFVQDINNFVSADTPPYSGTGDALRQTFPFFLSYWFSETEPFSSASTSQQERIITNTYKALATVQIALADSVIIPMQDEKAGLPDCETGFQEDYRLWYMPACSCSDAGVSLFGPNGIKKDIDNIIAQMKLVRNFASSFLSLVIDPTGAGDQFLSLVYNNMNTVIDGVAYLVTFGNVTSVSNYWGGNRTASNGTTPWFGTFQNWWNGDIDKAARANLKRLGYSLGTVNNEGECATTFGEVFWCRSFIKVQNPKEQMSFEISPKNAVAAIQTGLSYLGDKVQNIITKDGECQAGTGGESDSAAESIACTTSETKGGIVSSFAEWLAKQQAANEKQTITSDELNQSLKALQKAREDEKDPVKQAKLDGMIESVERAVRLWNLSGDTSTGSAPISQNKIANLQSEQLRLQNKSAQWAKSFETARQGRGQLIDEAQGLRSLLLNITSAVNKMSCPETAAFMVGSAQIANSTYNITTQEKSDTTFKSMGTPGAGLSDFSTNIAHTAGNMVQTNPNSALCQALQQLRKKIGIDE